MFIGEKETPNMTHQQLFDRAIELNKAVLVFTNGQVEMEISGNEIRVCGEDKIAIDLIRLNEGFIHCTSDEKQITMNEANEILKRLGRNFFFKEDKKSIFGHGIKFGSPAEKIIFHTYMHYVFKSFSTEKRYF